MLRGSLVIHFDGHVETRRTSVRIFVETHEVEAGANRKKFIVPLTIGFVRARTTPELISINCALAAIKGRGLLFGSALDQTFWFESISQPRICRTSTPSAAISN